MSSLIYVSFDISLPCRIVKATICIIAKPLHLSLWLQLDSPRGRQTAGSLDQGSDKPQVRQTESLLDRGSDRPMIKKRKNLVYQTFGLQDPWSIGPFSIIGLSDPRSIGPFPIIGLSDPRSIGPFPIIGLQDPFQ